MVEKYKTIKISEKTYNTLSKLGDLNDSFDSVIWSLIYDKMESINDSI